MAEGFRHSCLGEVERLGNDELLALMAGVGRHDRQASRRLIATVQPLLLAFYEGQVLARRIQRGDVAHLVRQTFDALYRQSTSDDPSLPFRAWLIETARSTLLDHLRNRNANPYITVDTLAGAPAHDQQDALGAL